MSTLMKDSENDLTVLCNNIRKMSKTGDYDKCFGLIYSSMSLFPDSPEPHNLLGIVLEKTGNHSLAMKHFRVALALDPAYVPANRNLMFFGSPSKDGDCAFDMSDCSKDNDLNKKEIVYIGRQFRTEYDRFGIGQCVKL